MTRMFMVPPSQMCQQHILGEHKELHMIAGSLKRAIDGDDRHRATLEGQADAGNIDVRQLASRHRTLEAYGNWDSPLPSFNIQEASFANGHIDTRRSRRDLRSRCSDCAQQMEALA